MAMFGGTLIFMRIKEEIGAMGDYHGANNNNNNNNNKSRPQSQTQPSKQTKISIHIE